METWNVATFAGGSPRFYLSALRLGRIAKKMPGIANVRIFNKKDLKLLDKNISCIVEENKSQRGYGYWLWKPLVVREGLKQSIRQGHHFIYLDAGCEININENSTQRLQDYAYIADQSGPIAMVLPRSTLAQWCKRKTLDHFDISLDEARSIPLMEAGVLLFGLDPANHDFINAWLESARFEGGRLFDDSTGPLPEYPEFIDHRHDSAVLCCLFYKMGLRGMPTETDFPGKWLSVAPSYPFWALRNKYPFSIAPGTPGDLVRRGLLRIRGIKFPEWEERL